MQTLDFSFLGTHKRTTRLSSTNVRSSHHRHHLLAQNAGMSGGNSIVLAIKPTSRDPLVTLQAGFRHSRPSHVTFDQSARADLTSDQSLQIPLPPPGASRTRHFSARSARSNNTWWPIKMQVLSNSLADFDLYGRHWSSVEIDQW